MSEGIEKKCINIEKKSINKTHSYSISIYIDGMGQFHLLFVSDVRTVYENFAYFILVVFFSFGC